MKSHRGARSVSCMASFTAPASFVSSLGMDFKKSSERCSITFKHLHLSIYRIL